MYEKWRYEQKYILSLKDAEIIKQRLDCLLPKDPHILCEKFYSVNSLYFDDIRDIALHDKENGINYREKWRMRLYNKDQKIFI